MTGTWMNFDEIDLGLGLKPIREKVTQESINRYGQASGDMNPLHVDPEWAAKNSPFKGTIAHGMTSLAFVSRLLTENFGRRWLYGGTIDVGFKQPVRPGDEISAKAKVIAKKEVDGKKQIELSVFCENQNRDAVITGTATITFD